MIRYVRPSVSGITLAVIAAGLTFAQEKKIVGGPPPHVKERVAAVERLIESRTEESIPKFIDEHLSPALKSAKSPQEWVAELKGIRQGYRGFNSVVLRPAPGGIAITFGGSSAEDTPLLVEIDPNPPHLITGLRAGPQAEPTAGGPPAPKLDIDWENLRDKLKEEEAAGFSGSVLVVRDGNIILHEGFGLADRQRRMPNRPDTIFAIGSTPIDFTQAAILKLEEMGKLSTADPISKHLPGVPDDKKAMSIDHLMTGRSGLPNFHGRSQDADPDNAWIDRAEALQRILAEQLLFEPGTDRAHSHSAFGLLAGIVEMVSGDTYAGFLEKHFFGPAGMKSTSHYEDIRASTDDVAIGYGGTDYTPVNSPKNWGKTSWLVLGSGGMVSTTGDLYRWNQALRSGAVLSPAAAEKYWRVGGGVFVGGNMHGFYTAYTTGPGTMFFLCTNDIGREVRTQRLADALVELVHRPKFRLGIALRHTDDAVMVESVVPRSPADRAGFAAGDKLTAVNGRPFDPDSAPDLLKTQVSAGKPLTFEIRRGDKTMTLTVTPSAD